MGHEAVDYTEEADPLEEVLVDELVEARRAQGRPVVVDLLRGGAGRGGTGQDRAGRVDVNTACAEVTAELEGGVVSL